MDPELFQTPSALTIDMPDGSYADITELSVPVETIGFKKYKTEHAGGNTPPQDDPSFHYQLGSLMMENTIPEYDFDLEITPNYEQHYEQPSWTPMYSKMISKHSIGGMGNANLYHIEEMSEIYSHEVNFPEKSADHWLEVFGASKQESDLYPTIEYKKTAPPETSPADWYKTIELRIQNAGNFTPVWPEQKPVDVPIHYVDQELVRGSKAELTAEEIVKAMKTNRVVKNAPSLKAMVRDATRDTIIRHVKGLINEAEETEQAALQDLMSFYAECIAELGADSDSSLGQTARDMRDNLTFIGEKERAEAVGGIAEFWKARLREDPKRQLCAVAGISAGEAETKSDLFMLDSIFGNFTDEELEEFKGRLVLSVDELTTEPEHASIVLLDDWVISGAQMKDAYSTICTDEISRKYGDCVEIQLITSTRSRIESGLKTYDYDSGDKKIPIRAYFQSHSATQDTDYTKDGHRAYESGSHSSVDYDFEDTISKMIEKLPDRNSDGVYSWPRATRIIREYRHDPLMHVDRFKRSRDSQPQPTENDSDLFEHKTEAAA